MIKDKMHWLSVALLLVLFQIAYYVGMVAYQFGVR